MSRSTEHSSTAMVDLFGSDSDSDQPVDPAKAKGPALEDVFGGEISSSDDDTGKREAARERIEPEIVGQQDDEEEEEDEDVDDGVAVKKRFSKPFEARGPPTEILAEPFWGIADTAKLYFFRLPVGLGIDPEPFVAEDALRKGEQLKGEELDKYKEMLRTPTIRWRKYVDDYGKERVESNARLVTWSDGSIQLLLGDEAFDIAETTLPTSSAVDVYTEIQSTAEPSSVKLLQGCGSVTQKLTVDGSKLGARMNLQKMKKMKQAKTIKTKAFSMNEIEKKYAEAARLAAKEERMRRKAREQNAGDLDDFANFLEDDYSDGDDNEEEDFGRSSWTSRRPQLEEDDLISRKLQDAKKGKAVVNREKSSISAEPSGAAPENSDEESGEEFAMGRSSAKRRRVFESDDEE